MFRFERKTNSSPSSSGYTPLHPPAALFPASRSPALYLSIASCCYTPLGAGAAMAALLLYRCTQIIYLICLVPLFNTLFVYATERAYLFFIWRLPSCWSHRTFTPTAKSLVSFHKCSMAVHSYTTEGSTYGIIRRMASAWLGKFVVSGKPRAKDTMATSETNLFSNI